MSSSTCRIIGGKWRGRKVSFDDAEGLRPTTDRIRETLFNWLQPYVAHSSCLDCFAGSGVLAFEAVSRGAANAVVIENNARTVANLKSNMNRLQADNIELVQQDALRWIQTDAAAKLAGDNGFDLVFLDPPFQQELLPVIAASLASSGILSEDAIIYVEQAIDSQSVMPADWQCLKQKTAGRVSFKLYGASD